MALATRKNGVMIFKLVSLCNINILWKVTGGDFYLDAILAPNTVLCRRDQIERDDFDEISFQELIRFLSKRSHFKHHAPFLLFHVTQSNWKSVRHVHGNLLFYSTSTHHTNNSRVECATVDYALNSSDVIIAPFSEASWADILSYANEVWGHRTGKRSVVPNFVE